MSPPACPPQPFHRRTRLLPQLRAGPRVPGRFGEDRRTAVATEENFQAGKGLTGLDEHQVPTWTSCTAGPPCPSSPPPSSPSPQPPDEPAPPRDGQIPRPQRNRPAPDRLRHPPRPRHHRMPAMVTMATPAPVPRPPMPLPAASSTNMKITNYDWSTTEGNLGPPRRGLTCANGDADLIKRRLTRGLAVKINRPPPPAAPMSGRHDRPVVPLQSGWSGRFLPIVERAPLTLRRSKT
jgi:hypothetical protein